MDSKDILANLTKFKINMVGQILYRLSIIFFFSVLIAVGLKISVILIIIISCTAIIYNFSFLIKIFKDLRALKFIEHIIKDEKDEQ